MGIVRISCASFVRIKCDNLYVLSVNIDRHRQRETVLSPIGGAMQVSAKEGREIMRQLGLTPESFDKPPGKVVDLRFRVERALIPKVCELYLTLNADPTRELHEELGLREGKIFTKRELRRAGFKLTRVGLGYEFAPTHRSGQAGQGTLRLITIYDLEGSAAAMSKLWGFGFPLFYVTAQEIREGRTTHGTKIASISETLLSPKPSFPDW